MNPRKQLLTLVISGLLAACAGDDGKTGMDGEDGVDGMDGEDGVDGMDGEDGVDGMDGDDGDDGMNGEDGDGGMSVTTRPALIRLATIAEGAELTGMEKTDNGHFFFNVQHPDSSLPDREGLAAVGAWVGVDIEAISPATTPVEPPTPGSEDAQTTRVAMGEYQVLGREGDTFDGDLPYGFGNITNAAGTMALRQSNNPDFNAFIPSNTAGSEGYLFSAWEDRPGGVTRLELSWDATAEEWDVEGAMDVDFSAVEGTMINCFGSVTPWGTPMTSEENYEAENAEHWNDDTYASGYPNYADVQRIQAYLGGTFPNPYDYGYIVEITDPTGTPTPVKHFTMGRVAHENPIVMPDQRTVYLTDDGGFKGFFKFVADEAGDLSEGVLYAAKVMQDGTTDSSRAGFNLSWIEIGRGDNASIEAYIDTFDGIDESDFVADSTNYITDAMITEYASEYAAGGAITNPYIPFLETLRTAGAMGATVEFNKMEGININYAGVASGAVPFMYVAMADVTGSMSDDTGDIQVSDNRCGIVYRIGLTADYDAIRMDPAVTGGPYDATDATDRCSVESIAQPDNVTVLQDGRVLIGEDTSNHHNNMLWIWDPAHD